MNRKLTQNEWTQLNEDISCKSSKKITALRPKHAMQFCERTCGNLLYPHLGPRWVREAVRWGCTQLPENVALVLDNSRMWGELPGVEWGKVALSW